jgi:hypothetical protein
VVREGGREGGDARAPAKDTDITKITHASYHTCDQITHVRTRVKGKQRRYASARARGTASTRRETFRYACRAAFRAVRFTACRTGTLVRAC